MGMNVVHRHGAKVVEFYPLRLSPQAFCCRGHRRKTAFRVRCSGLDRFGRNAYARRPVKILKQLRMLEVRGDGADASEN